LNVKKKFISSLGWQSVNVLTQITLQLIFIAVMVRQLSKDDMGVMGIALALVGFIEIFSQIGIGPALIQRKDLTPSQISGAFFISLLLGIAFTVSLYFLAPAAGKFWNHAPLTPVLQVIGLSFLISAISIVPKSLIIKKMQFKKLFFASATAMTIGNLIIGITLAMMGYKIWAYVFALLSQNLIMTIAFWIQNPVDIRAKWRWADIKGMMSYGAGSTLFNMFNYAATKADTLIVGKFFDVGAGAAGESRMAATGVYDRSVWLMGLPITVLGKLSDSVMFSGLSMIQDEKQKLQKAFFGGAYFISLLIIPACVFMVFFTEEIVLLFLGDQYVTAIPVVRILFIGVAIRSLIKLSDAVVRALKAVYRASLIKFLFLVLVCAGTYYGLSSGLTGVAWAIVGAISMQFIVMTWLSLRLIGADFKTMLGKMVPGLILGLIVLCASSLVTYLLDLIELNFLANLIIGIAFNGIAVVLIAIQAPWIFGKGSDNILKTLAAKYPKAPILRTVNKKLDRKKRR
jgi:O-antigen/teichoic acid export membrane protein